MTTTNLPLGRGGAGFLEYVDFSNTALEGSLYPV